MVIESQASNTLVQVSGITFQDGSSLNISLNDGGAIVTECSFTGSYFMEQQTVVFNHTAYQKSSFSGASNLIANIRGTFPFFLIFSFLMKLQILPQNAITKLFLVLSCL